MRRILITVMFALISSTIWVSFHKSKRSQLANSNLYKNSQDTTVSPSKNSTGANTTKTAETAGEQILDTSRSHPSNHDTNYPSAARVPAATDTTGSNPPDQLERWLKQRDAQAQWNVSRSASGEVIAISGGTLAKPSSEGDIRRFAEDLATQLGIPPSQLEAKAQKLDGTILSEPTVINQKFLDYEVYGGFLKLMQNRQTGALYYAMNSLAQVGEPSLVQTISDQSAIALVKAHQQKTNESADEVFVGHTKPFVFVKEPKKSELAWSIYSRHKAFITEYLVSAKDGEILATVQRWNE